MYTAPCKEYIEVVAEYCLFQEDIMITLL